MADVWNTETRLMHRAGLVRRPVAAQWLVTAACDMKCPHCYSAAGKRRPDELSTDEARRLIIDPLVALGCPLLVLAGGELLLRPDIPALVDYACSRGLTWAMHTHGMHVARHRDLLERHPPALAAISLDGDRSFHDAFRGRAGSFDAALEAAAVLADAGCTEVVLGTTVTRDNADRVADLFGLVVRSRAHSWGLHLFAPEGRGHDHAELLPTPGQLRRVAAFARRRRGVFPIELCNEWGSAGRDDLYYRDQPFTCGAGSISLVISATGDVLPCTTTDPAEREGNVRQTPLGELWVRRFDRFRSGAALEGGECWLQSRHGVRCAEHAFGARARAEPLWAERLPPTLVTLRRPGRARLVGTRSATTVRLMAAGLVFLQGCTKPSSSGQQSPQTPPRAEPEASPPRAEAGPHWADAELRTTTGFPEVLGRDLETHFQAQGGRGRWSRLRHALRACEAEPDDCEAARPHVDPLLQPPSRAALHRHLDTLAQGHAPRFEEALAVLDAAELRPTYDPWLAGHLWRSVRAQPVSDPAGSHARIRLFARLAQHHRVIDALKAAQQTVGPAQLRPWLKKSAPPPDARRVIVPPGLARAARAAYADATATTWQTLALSLTIEGDGVVLARGGQTTTLRRGASVSLGRLDVLWCPGATTLRASGDRSLEVPAGTEVTLFDLPTRLSLAARTALLAAVSRALADEPGALDALEPDLPLAHAIIREQLQAAPQATGAPGLRALLVAFDE